MSGDWSGGVWSPAVPGGGSARPISRNIPAAVTLAIGRFIMHLLWTMYQVCGGGKPVPGTIFLS
jgi:hypothetical protein